MERTDGTAVHADAQGPTAADLLLDETLVVLGGWPDVPCAELDAEYRAVAHAARAARARLDAGELHSAELVELLRRVGRADAYFDLMVAHHRVMRAAASELPIRIAV